MTDKPHAWGDKPAAAASIQTTHWLGCWKTGEKKHAGCYEAQEGKHAPAPPSDALPFSDIQREADFAEGLRSLINRHSQENASNTPDFILTGYLVACLDAFNKASRERECWYGKSLHI